MARNRLHLDADYAANDPDGVRFVSAAGELGVARGELLKLLVRDYLEFVVDDVREAQGFAREQTTRRRELRPSLRATRARGPANDQ
jgi:hypothetical protein